MEKLIKKWEDEFSFCEQFVNHVIKKQKTMDSKNQIQKREIKFRAWDKDDKTMWYMDEVESDQLPNDLLSDFLDNYYGCDLLQYIGLKDKKGKEIYEGDICKDDDGIIGTIEWDEKTAAWCRTRNDNNDHYYYSDFTRYEIVGNIYETYGKL